MYIDWLIYVINLFWWFIVKGIIVGVRDMLMNKINLDVIFKEFLV